jgi:hypothetical protein
MQRGEETACYVTENWCLYLSRTVHFGTVQPNCEHYTQANPYPADFRRVCANSGLMDTAGIDKFCTTA